MKVPVPDVTLVMPASNITFLAFNLMLPRLYVPVTLAVLDAIPVLILTSPVVTFPALTLLTLAPFGYNQLPVSNISPAVVILPTEILLTLPPVPPERCPTPPVRKKT